MAVEARAAFAALLLWAAGAAFAQMPPRAAACAACHGGDGNAPDPAFPSIAGQPRLFIENQLVLIREGLRDVPSMKAVMEGVGDLEIGQLAAHFSALPARRPELAVQPALQQRGAQLSKQGLCGTCHLPDYRGQNQVPRLSAQNEGYLLQAMKQFRDDPGPGRDTIMAATLRGLSDADLAALAHYLASREP